jgi:hypothetical protein
MRDLIHASSQREKHNFVARGRLLGGSIRGRPGYLGSKDGGRKTHAKTNELNLIPEVQLSLAVALKDPRSGSAYHSFLNNWATRVKQNLKRARPILNPKSTQDVYPMIKGSTV